MAMPDGGTEKAAAGPVGRLFAALGLRQPARVEPARQVSGYPGPAFVLAADGGLLAANDKGRILADALARGYLPEVDALIGTVVRSGTLAGGVATLAGAEGERIFDISVAPLDGERIAVLARDLTLERNLRTALVDSRERFKDLVEASSDFAWEVGADGTFVYVSPRGALGHSAARLIGRRPEEFVVDAARVGASPFLSHHPVDSGEVWMLRADGEQACVLTTAVPLWSREGEWQGVRGVCRDVTAERERDMALARAVHREQVLGRIVGTIRDEVDPTRMLDVAAETTSRALGAEGCRIFRRGGDGRFAVTAETGDTRMVGDLAALVDEVDLDHLPRTVETDHLVLLVVGTQYRRVVNGALVLWRGREGVAWTDDDRLLTADVANQLGIALEQLANHERVLKLSRTDGLTGLLNRRAFFEEELPRRIERLRRAGATGALVYVDLDNFKLVNDVHGHQAGDDALLAVRDLLEEMSRPGDLVVRLGGDEFVMWLDGIPADSALKRAYAISAAAGRLRHLSGSPDRPLGFSIGVAVYDPEKGESIENLLARGDAAMYTVKKRSKGGVEMAPPPGAASNGEGTGA